MDKEWWSNFRQQCLIFGSLSFLLLLCDGMDERRNGRGSQLSQAICLQVWGFQERFQFQVEKWSATIIFFFSFRATACITDVGDILWYSEPQQAHQETFSPAVGGPLVVHSIYTLRRRLHFDTCFAASLDYLPNAGLQMPTVIYLNFLHLSGKKVFLHDFLLRLIQFSLTYLHYSNFKPHITCIFTSYQATNYI